MRESCLLQFYIEPLKYTLKSPESEIISVLGCLLKSLSGNLPNTPLLPQGPAGQDYHSSNTWLASPSFIITRKSFRYDSQANASKRLHILRVLRRSGVEINDLITIYTALIRSLLEYCCVVWHHALPSYLSQELERIQKRALKIIVPALSSVLMKLFKL